MKSHYSQTFSLYFRHTLLVLHPYETTLLSNWFLSYMLFPMVLHPYKATLLSNYKKPLCWSCSCFTSLWNYTTLKHEMILQTPSRSFISLWNYTTLKLFYVWSSSRKQFYIPMKSHYSQTHGKMTRSAIMFYIPMKSHYSQTITNTSTHFLLFYIPMKSHYSQTSIWQYTHYKRVVISYNILSKKKLSSAFRPRPVCHALPTCDSNIFFFILFDLLYPVEFICLSNFKPIFCFFVFLLYPVEFTCLSNLF